MPDNRSNPDDQEQIGRSVNEETAAAADEDFEDDLEDTDEEDEDAEGIE